MLNADIQYYYLLKVLSVKFVDIVNKACFISERDEVYYIGLANNGSKNKEKIDDIFSKTAANQDLAHAYLIPNRTKQWWIDRFNDTPWEGFDLTTPSPIFVK